jgi:anti-sigma regulatory factor (Ser/Thr protein kinase)
VSAGSALMIQAHATRAAAIAGLAGGDWRLSPDPAPSGWACLPEITMRAPGADRGPVCAAREFTVATLRRWGLARRCDDITIVVSEMVTNALRHALRAVGDARGRLPIRVGLYNPGPWVLCAVADPSQAVPVPQAAGCFAETGRGLHIIRALSDDWGYTAPDDAGKVVWAMFARC